MNELTGTPVKEMSQFLADAQEKIIRQFIDIVDLGSEMDDATNPAMDDAFTEYAQSMLAQELKNRGYEISTRHVCPTQIAEKGKGMNYQLVLLHDGKEVAYNVIEVSVGDTRWTGYGMGMR